MATPTSGSLETVSGKVTSWLPVTTAWPRVYGCESSFISIVANTLAGWDPGYGYFVQPGLRCLPPEATSWWDYDHLPDKQSGTVVSLGPITCPEAFTTAKTSVKDEHSTLVACCPSGYTFRDFKGAGTTGECVSVIDAGQVIKYATYDMNRGNSSLKTLTAASSTVVAGIPLNGWIFADATTTTSSTTSTTPTETGPTSTPTTTSSTSDSGLSTSAKIGIGVGVPVAFLAAVGIIAALMLLRRRKHQYAPAPSPYDGYYQEDPAGSTRYAYQIPTELATQEIPVQLPSPPPKAVSPPPQELPSH